MLALTIRQGRDVRHYRFREGGLRIGRASDNDVVLESRTVSWHHARLSITDGGVRVEDLGSHNGTFVDQDRVDDAVYEVPVTVRLGRHVQAVVSDVSSTELELAPGVAADPPIDRGSSQRSTEPAVVVGAGHLAATLLAAIARGEPEERTLSAVLRATVEQLGFDAGRLVELRGGRPAVLRHAVGDWDGLNDDVLAAVERSVKDGERHLPAEGLSLAVHSRDDWSLVALLRGKAGGSTDLSALSDALACIVGGPAEPDLGESSTSGDRPVISLAPDAVTGSSRVMTEFHERFAGAVQSDLPVLLLGETGVGKEVYARALHALGPRSARPLRGVNASAIPDSLLEATLFGAEEGAATGVRRQVGLMREADAGSFFLDEIGDMSATLQAKLLRALDQGEVLPVGASRPVSVDLRIIAATNRDLAADVEDGRFRRDLHHRLAGHVFRIPSLRERRDDVPELVAHFLTRECRKLDRPVPGVTVKAMEWLRRHDWPGNVRELSTVIRRLVHERTGTGPIRAAELPAEMARSNERPSVSLPGSLDERIDAFQEPLVREALEKCGWNKSATAAQLGISRVRLRALMRRFGMEPGDAKE